MPYSDCLTFQEDVLIGTLTVLETLTGVANLRLPSTVSKLEKQGIIDGTLAEMGLSDCKNTFVGNWLLRGISGETQSSVMNWRSLISNTTMLDF